MKLILACILLFVAPPAMGLDPWILQTGPELVESMPLQPVQPVTSWRGMYSDGTEIVWVYATKSPHFMAPASLEVRPLATGAWSAFFFPLAWKSAQRSAWIERWLAEHRVLASLPSSRWPQVFPSVLRKG